MPTITPTGRATVGGSPDEYRLPRSTVKASTGMDLPPLEASKTPAEGSPEAKTGQENIQREDTNAPAVTLSPQLTALARKQQKLQSEIEAQRAREAEWAKKEADYVPKSSFKAKLQQNAAEALSELGVNYEELTNLLVAQSQGDDPVKAIRSELDEIKANQEKATNDQYEATLRQYKAEATSLVSKDPTKYFLINKKNEQDAVVQHIVETWQEDPEQVLTVEEAANDIEEFLREEAKQAKALLEELEGPPKETTTEEKKLPPPRPAARTLSQQVESAPTRTYNQFQHMSMKERIAAATARAQK